MSGIILTLDFTLPRSEPMALRKQRFLPADAGCHAHAIFEDALSAE
ncbi:hypothetical protein [Nitrosomonas sp.]|nr:hypothetical protein [Nitrosomonas sp.]MDP1788232.1 hypothetical protein [Nitrosomonas sp.]